MKFWILFSLTFHLASSTDFFLGSWKEDEHQRTGLKEYLVARHVSWFKRLVANSATFQLTVNIQKYSNGYFFNGQAGPQNEKYQFYLMPNIVTEVDLSDLGGMTKAKSFKNGNTILVDLFQNEKLIVKKTITVEKDRMIYSLLDVKSGAVLHQVLNRQVEFSREAPIRQEWMNYRIKNEGVPK